MLICDILYLRMQVPQVCTMHKWTVALSWGSCLWIAPLLQSTQRRLCTYTVQLHCATQARPQGALWKEPFTLVANTLSIEARLFVIVSLPCFF